MRRPGWFAAVGLLLALPFCSGGRTVVISGAGHMVNMEKPEEFNRAVFEFLNQLGKR